jgi:hypothetical protein
VTATRRLAVVGFLALCVLVVAAAAGLAALTGNGTADVTVDTFEPRVAVGNESADAAGGSGEVVTCTDRGPMPGNAALEGRLEFSRPAGDEGPRDAPYRVAVTVGDGLITDSLNVSLPAGESTRWFLPTVVDQPNGLSGGDRVTVRAQVVTDGETVASANRTVTVAERDRPCAESEG